MNHEKLKSKIDELKTKAAKASGVLSTLMKQLKKEFGCNSLESAEALLARLEKKEQADLHQLEDDLDQFEQEYKDVLSN